MSRVFRSLDSLAREHTETAVSVIHEVMTDPFAENKDRLKAAEQILDRGHGKPLSATISIPASKQVAARLAAMTDDQLLECVHGAELPRLVSQGQLDIETDPLLD